jgi:hypothetical protein
MVSPPFACGQWLINSLSYSENLCPCAPTDTVEFLLTIGKKDRQAKHERMLMHLPKHDHHSWHYDTGFYDSIRWLHHHAGTGIIMEDGEELGELFFQNVTVQMRSYIEKFWRQHAIKVSNSEMGFMMKLHYTAEAKGYINLIPHSKIFTIENFEHWQDIFIKKSNAAPDIVRHWKTMSYQKEGFVFDLDRMLRDESFFLKQMSAAYDYVKFKDFNDVKDHLLEYRKKYLLANTKYTSNNR